MNARRALDPLGDQRRTRPWGLVFVVLCVLSWMLLAGAEDACAQRPPRPKIAPEDTLPLPILQHPDEGGFTQLIIELRAGRELALTDFSLAKNSRIWIPVIPVLEMLELSVTQDSVGTIRATLEPSSTRLVMHPRAARIQRGDEVRSLGPWELFYFEERLYASAGAVGWLLQVQVYEDMSELTVTFEPIDDLPLGQRLRRERMRRLSELAQAEPDLVFEPEREAWSGATLDWGIATPSFEDFENSVYDLGFGGSAIGGALDLRYRARIDGVGPDRFDARWQGVWPQQRWLRQLELGSTRGTGPRGRPIRGISLSNSPFLRSVEFGYTVLRGQLDPGWEVEIYRNGRLIAWDRVDERGSWEFTVPIDYGPNPVEIRAYGPNGEVRITERAVRVDFDRIPARQFEYGLSAGECQTGNCDQTVNLDLRYGFNGRWTARTGYEGFRRELGKDAHHPYFSMTGSVTDPLRLGAERVVDAWWRGFASFETTSDLRLTLDHFRYDRHLEGGVLVRLGERERTLANFFWRPNPKLMGMFLTFSGERVDTIFDRRTQASWGATAMFQGIRLSSQWKEEWLRTSTGSLSNHALAYQASMILRARKAPLLNGIQIRVQGEIDTGGSDRDWVQMLLGKTIGRSSRIEVGAGWYNERREPQFTVAISSTGPYAFVTANAVRDPSGRTNTHISAEGSLMYNPGSNRVEGFPFRSLGQGGLGGTVFLDTNGNGSFDAGESGVAGVRLIVGNLVTETDEYGRYSVWFLVPFEATDIRVDSNSLPNPLWIPVFELAAAPVSPNGFRRIDLPIVEGVVVEGRVRTREGNALYASGAVPLRLVQIEGDREYSTRSFRDGEFYLMSVAPGLYEVEIDSRWLEARGLAPSSSASWELEVQAGAGVVEMDLELEPTS